MESTTVAQTGTEGKAWGGGKEPLKASYGKLMMWFFILSDALTFTGFLSGYGLSRFKFIQEWPIADEVFNHFPFLHGLDAPMYYVALMTFILIFSSVTMVLAVDAGHHMNKKKVVTYMALTILGGLIFLGSQAWEWKNFINGSYGAVETKSSQILQFVNSDGHQIAIADFAKELPREAASHEGNNGLWYYSGNEQPTYSLDEIKAGFAEKTDISIRTMQLNEAGEKTILDRAEAETYLNERAVRVVEGANLTRNEYGQPLFADFFFFITGFHGFHVSIGIMLLIVTFFNVLGGTYERRGSYEMVEKVGLYWHFVDLVWVFVFTFFYLV
ncbi:MAG: cytochrome c oxidase subunit 3 [Psychroflexus sp.]|nr:cytochrome c oxidase subunit 3 [Psychroflexus sp.]